jgi:hypothetical protein
LVLTIISYAVPASLLTGVTLWYGKGRQVAWSIWEPVMVVIPFIMVYLYMLGTFGGIRPAVVAMGFHPIAVVLIAGLGGFFAGLSLIPRLFYSAQDVPRLMMTATTAFLIGLLCLKMFFLMAAVANPKALISPD